jgi:hypothetical protein
MSTTGNLVTGNTWNGAPNSTTPTGGISGGYQPTFNTSTNTLQFGYTTGTASQTYAINRALAIAGTGIEVAGYNYSWDYYNTGYNRGTLTGQVQVTTTANTLTYNYSMPQNSAGWVTQSGTQNFPTLYTPSQLGNLTLSFTGKDDRFWAGYYGPLVRNVNLQLDYGIDPCKTNPAYSPSCSGYSGVYTSTNLGNNFAISTAIANSGAGLSVFGFNYGFSYNIGSPYCTFQFIICWSTADSSAGAGMSITNKSGQVIASQGFGYSNQYSSGTVTAQYIFPSTLNSKDLGNFSLNGWTNGNAWVGNFYVNELFGADPCINNHLYSSDCRQFQGQVLTNVNAAKASSTAASSTVTVGQTGQTTLTTSSTTVTPPIGQTSSNPTMTSVTTVNVGGADVSSTGTVTAQDNVPQAVKDSQASATTSAPATATQSSTTVVTATNPSNTQPGQTSPKIGPSATASQALKQAQAREQATQKAAVQNAQAVVNASTAQSQETATTAIASINAMAAANSQPAQSSTAGSVVIGSSPVTQAVSTTSNTQQAQVQLPQPTANNTSSNKSNSNSGGFFGLNPMSSNGSGLGLTASIQQTQPVAIQQYTPVITTKSERLLEVEVQSTPLGFGGLGRPGNPLNDIMMGRFELPSSTQEQRTETVNRNVQPNELSVGVTLEAMAVQPRGFEAYSVALKDAAFYEPKEIYRNQTTVDNVRALRQMASDRVYQQMLDMQYKIGE